MITQQADTSNEPSLGAQSLVEEIDNEQKTTHDVNHNCMMSTKELDYSRDQSLPYKSPAET